MKPPKQLFAVMAQNTDSKKWFFDTSFTDKKEADDYAIRSTRHWPAKMVVYILAPKRKPKKRSGK